MIEFKSISHAKIIGRGNVFMVECDKDRGPGDTGLVGISVLIDGTEYKVRGVEYMSATGIILKGDKIGLIVSQSANNPGCTTEETLGAKIRGALSPYNTLIEMVNDGRFQEQHIQEQLKNTIHRQCIQILIEISKECEIEPSDELINVIETIHGQHTTGNELLSAVNQAAISLGAPMLNKNKLAEWLHDAYCSVAIENGVTNAVGIKWNDISTNSRAAMIALAEKLLSTLQVTDNNFVISTRHGDNCKNIETACEKCRNEFYQYLRKNDKAN